MYYVRSMQVHVSVSALSEGGMMCFGHHFGLVPHHV
jgi:hypothetical protein